MKLICPNCEKMVLVEPYTYNTTIKVKNEPIEVELKLYRCLECAHLIQDPKNPQDELDIAYRIYRQKHHLLQPEEIIAIRKTYDLSQQDLSNLTGIGIATINRYENGSLQSEAHDNMLSLLKNPQAVKELLDKNKDKFSKEKIASITQKIYELYKKDNLKNIELIFERYNDKEFTGNRPFSLQKLINLISLIANKLKEKNIELTRTKLNKLLFYIDFLSFKQNNCSITGAVYAHLPYGPCLESFDTVISSLVEENILGVKEVTYQDKSYEVLEPLQKPKTDIFTKDELNLIETILEKLSGLSASELSNISHKEKAYTATKNGELIEYSFAKYLQGVEDV